MKILLTMFVLLSFSFILSGCDNKKNEKRDIIKSNKRKQIKTFPNKGEKCEREKDRGDIRET